MKIKMIKPTVVDVEIGQLDKAGRLPTKSRLMRKIPTICDSCGENVTDEWFIVGFKSGHKNLILHEKCCKPEDVVGGKFSDEVTGGGISDRGYAIGSELDKEPIEKGVSSGGIVSPKDKPARGIGSQ